MKKLLVFTRFSFSVFPVATLIKKIILFFSFLCINTTFAQELPQVVSQTPEAAALSKYSEYPVGTYTGIPNINVPLYTIKSGDISFPINLNYHAGGFRVSEESSWIGLGWTLSVNSAITRTVNGVEDFHGSMASSIIPYHSAPKIVDITSGTTYPAVYATPTSEGLIGPFGTPGSNGFMGHYLSFAFSRFRSNIANVDYNQVDYNPYQSISFDWEPDIYSINMLNHNGKFVFDQNEKIHFLEKEDIKIIYDKSNKTWSASTNDGFKYFFEAKETSQNFYGREVNGTWYLSKIISPNKKEMDFIYEDATNTSIQYSYSEYADINQSVPSIDPSSFFPVKNPLSSLHYTKKYLKRINFDEGYVLFERDNNLREDLKNGERLKKIQIFDLNDVLIKEFEFITDYFNSNNNMRGYFTEQFVDNTEYEYYKKRLKLNKVIERNGIEFKEYEFKYSNKNLPNKDSFKQDHWGYYNDAGTSSLIPTFKGELVFQYRYQGEGTGDHYCGHIIGEHPTRYVHLNGSNRESNPSTIDANILTEIIYPTKGSTQFEFEGNEFGNLEDIENEYIYQDYVQNVTVKSFSNQANITIASENFPIEFPSDAIEIFNPSIELVVYPTGSNNVIVSPGMIAKFISNPITKYYYFNDVLTSENNYVLREELPLFPGEGATLLNNPISLEVVVPEISHDQTAVFTFKCRLKRENLAVKRNAGGLRVKKITHYDGIDHTNDIIKTYEYGYTTTNEDGIPEERSYGVLKTPIKYHFLSWNDVHCSSYFRFNSSNNYGLTYNQVSHIGYSTVIEKHGLNGELGKTIYEYYNDTNEFYSGDERPSGVPNTISKRLDGKLKKKSIHDNSNKIVYEETNLYSTLDEQVIKGVYQDGYKEPFIFGQGFYGNGGMHYYPIYSRWEPLTIQMQKTYNPNEEYVETTTTYQYNPENLLPSEIITTDSKGNTLKAKNYYPVDVTSTNYTTILGSPLSFNEYGAVDKLVGDFKTSQPVQVESYKNSTLLSRQRTNFNTWSGLTLPEYIQTAKGSGMLEDRIQFHEYDAKGNPLEVSKADGSHIYYVWGYNGQHPIAKIENKNPTALTQTQQNLIDAAKAASNSDISTATENNLRTALANLRNGFPEAMVTTYTYDPLIGVTSVTDPKGYTMYYEYDDFNRLEFVRDADGKILSENKYHYKAQ